jgi:hypothetical protein
VILNSFGDKAFESMEITEMSAGEWFGIIGRTVKVTRGHGIGTIRESVDFGAIGSDKRAT